MSKFPDNIYQYEVTPPPAVWDRLSADLDEMEADQPIASRLSSMEAIPPPAAWDKIQNQLYPPAQTISINRSGRISSYFKYAAAAVIIGLVAVMAIRFGTGKDDPENSSAQLSGKDDSPATATVPSISTPSQPTSADEQDELALQESRTAVAYQEPKRKNNRNAIRAAVNNNESSYNSSYPRSEYTETLYAYEDHIPTMKDRYVVLMTPDGNFIRMAKKWGDLLCCVSGEEQDEDCKDQLKKWQEKIAASPIAPAPGNFMDILSLVNSLNEDTQL